LKVIPAILTDSPQELETMLRLAESFADWVQIDIMDGNFVPSRSITAADLARVNTTLKLEIHLMVQNPESCFLDFHRAGAAKIIFHCEATSSPQQALHQLRELGLQAGIALNPETPVSAILPLAPSVDSVLFLSVNPGFYGSKFIPEVLDKIDAFRKLQPGVKTGIDGGIKRDNILEVASHGVDFLCVGSAIFKEPDPQRSFQQLQELLLELTTD
jgi:ribulose-phosphate 3-epimerase